MQYQSRELEAADEALSAAVDHGDVDTSARAFFLRAFIRAHASPDMSLQEAEREVREALARLEDGTVGDRTLAEGYVTLGELLFWNGRTIGSSDAGARALVHARRAGEKALESRAHAVIGGAMSSGQCDLGRARGARAERPRRRELGARSRSALVGAGRRGRSSGPVRRGAVAPRAARCRMDGARRELRARIGEAGAGAPGADCRRSLGGGASPARGLERARRDRRAGLSLDHRRDARAGAARAGRHEEALALAAEAEVLTSADDWVTDGGGTLRAGLRGLRPGRTMKRQSAMRAARPSSRTSTSTCPRRSPFLARARRDPRCCRALAGEAREALAEAIRLARIKGAGAHEERANAILDALPVPR